jgi:hypothetical protein
VSVKLWLTFKGLHSVQEERTLQGHCYLSGTVHVPNFVNDRQKLQEVLRLEHVWDIGCSEVP